MSAASAFGQPRFRIGAVIAIAVAAGLVAWLVLRDDGSSSSAHAQTPTSSATATTARKLATLAATVGHPIFWLGPKRGFTYELTRTSDGKVYVRYLPAGVDVGAGKPYLTVATYPFTGAFAAIQKEAAVKGAVTASLRHHGLAVLDAGYPESTHIAYPNVNYQVEVYDPTPAKAMQLVSAISYLGRLTASQSTGATGGAGPTAASVADLKTHATALGRPIYWAGPKRGYTYELTDTSNGRIFVRYLPPGIKPGDPRPLYMTVATYPFPGAYAALAKTAKGTGTIKLAHRGIGVVDGAYPKSIHLAYPGSDYQIEVYDPSPSAGRKLVASGAIAPVP
jgi:hypothetical protein